MWGPERWYAALTPAGYVVSAFAPRGEGRPTNDAVPIRISREMAGVVKVAERIDIQPVTGDVVDIDGGPAG